MLVLSRKKNESVFIGDGIKVMIIGIRGDTVRLGIEASRDIKVLRDEHLAIQKAKDTPA